MPPAGVVKLIVIALFFIVPVVIRMIKAGQDAAARRRMEQMRQAAEYEAMRTGRPADPPMALPPQAYASTTPPPMSGQQSVQDRLRELAARRQAQIEALRRARAQGGGVATTTPPTSFQGPRGGSAPAPAPVPRPQAGRQQAPRPQPQSRQARPQRRPTPPPPPTVQTEFPPPTNAIGGTAHEHEGDITHRLVPDAPPPPPLHPLLKPGSGKTGALGRSEILKAMVLREVLGRPVSMQDPHQS